MNFRKEIIIPPSDLKIDYSSKLLLLGSCFIDNIGKSLQNNKFQALVNPFGVLYNPISIAQSLDFILDKKVFTRDDVFFDEGLYKSFFFHSSFANIDSDLFLKEINNQTLKASSIFSELNVLILTFGTAYVYSKHNEDLVVANCHKLPAKQFIRKRLTVVDIIKTWTDLLIKISRFNPDIKVLFTVSPIRHLKDGEHENQLSKSTLLLAIDQLVCSFSNVYYFPSYEIVLDDLRDYRFYSDDMVHPSSLAIEYIWSKFSNHFFKDDTLEIMHQWQKLKKMLEHRPFNKNTDIYKQFLKQTLLKLENFRDKYPYFECSSEISALHLKIEQDLI